MRVIQAINNEPIRAIAIARDGRFVAASSHLQLTVLDLGTGNDPITGNCLQPPRQLGFTRDGNWVFLASELGIYAFSTSELRSIEIHTGQFSGAIAVSPDGRLLAATTAGVDRNSNLYQWDISPLRQKDPIEFWSPFERIAFSPNGEHIAGIHQDLFELRFGNTFGLNQRKLRCTSTRWNMVESTEPAFLTFSPHSRTVVYGWGGEFWVMETQTGQILKRVEAPDRPFRDAVFLGSGQLLATVNGLSVVRFWSTESWEVIREYEWGAGGITCLAATYDGLTCACGTDAGGVVIFDVDM